MVVEKEGGRLTQVVCDNAATLAYLANQACITPHIWLSRKDRLHFPDRMIFDLDPSEDDFEIVRSTARTLRGLLTEIGLPAFVMTTGSRGLHVTVPLERSADFDTVRAFAQQIAAELARSDPERLTTEQRKESRQGRLFLDVGRNAYAQTGVAPYAVRALPGAPVATPLDWSELEDPQMHARRFTLRSLPPNLDHRGDPWKEIAMHAASLEEPSGCWKPCDLREASGSDLDLPACDGALSYLNGRIWNRASCCNRHRRSSGRSPLARYGSQVSSVLRLVEEKRDGCGDDRV